MLVYVACLGGVRNNVVFYPSSCVEEYGSGEDLLWVAVKDTLSTELVTSFSEVALTITALLIKDISSILLAAIVVNIPNVNVVVCTYSVHSRRYVMHYLMIGPHS